MQSCNHESVHISTSFMNSGFWSWGKAKENIQKSRCRIVQSKLASISNHNHKLIKIYTKPKINYILYIPDKHTALKSFSSLSLNFLHSYSQTHSFSTLGFTHRKIVNGLSGQVEAVGSSLSFPTMQVCVRVFECVWNLKEKKNPLVFVPVSV